MRPLTSAERTPELPLAKELQRIKSVPLTHDSGITDAAKGSSFGSAVVKCEFEGPKDVPFGIGTSLGSVSTVFFGTGMMPQLRKLMRFR